ncbi:MAG: hypothetical protein JRE58_14210 [Deltaproteobacteria bacterium]|nr:hypothetical protein [Deltaproteobacteria bacterium]
MRNITLSADEILINQARQKAAQEKTSLNKLFREWMSQYANRDNAGNSYDSLMESLSTVKSGKKFTREEMNER